MVKNRIASASVVHAERRYCGGEKQLACKDAVNTSNKALTHSEDQCIGWSKGSLVTQSCNLLEITNGAIIGSYVFLWDCEQYS
jgi:hypothetical protein